MRTSTMRRSTMALAWLGVVTSGGSAAAQTTGLLDRPARLDVRDVPLGRALQQLADRSRVALVYSPSLLPSDNRVSCACAAATTRQALDTLLTATGFTFRESEGHVILVLAHEAPLGPTRSDSESRLPPTIARTVPDSAGPATWTATVVGRVTSDAGVPIANAVVSVPAARLSVTTNDAGVFEIVVPPERLSPRPESLHVVRLGYRPAVIEIRLIPGRVNADVMMSTQVLALDQVVVSGTAGNQERRAQSAVVSTIDAVERFAKTPVRGVSELMYAQSPGVSMTVASGTSGANTRIDIRGQASVTLTNYPLVFVDGIRITAGARLTAGNTVGGQSFNALDDLNPDDIQRIEIVKGPAAATLYGADASAGVIQLFTKKGRPGSGRGSKKVSFSVDRIDPNFRADDNYGACPAPLAAATSANPLCRGLPAGTIVRDNVLERNDVFGLGQAEAASFAAQGGGALFGYYASVDAANERGTTPSNYLTRRSGRVNLTWSATPALTVDANIGLVRADDRLPKGDQDVMGFLIGGDFGSPLSVVAGANGALAGGWYQPSETKEAIAAINTEDVTLRFTPSIQLRYAPFEWLSNRVTVGMDHTNTLATQQYPRNDFNWYTTALQNSGQIAATELNNTLYTVDYLGNIARRFGRGAWIASDLSFGSQWINATSQSLTGTAQGLITNANNLVSGGTTTAGAQAYAQSKSLGWFVQQQLGFNDRLFLQAAVRVDRNSAFGSRAGSFILPKVGASWVVSEEPFWRGRGIPASTLRLRAAFGTTGRSPSSSAALQTYVRSSYVTDAGQVMSGFTIGSPGNASLRPERGTELEMGLDAGFLSNRIGLELTYFDKRSKDLLLALPIAPSTGYASSPLVNIGEVANSGFEVGLRATLLSRAEASWDITASMNTLRNRVDRMGSVLPFVNTNNQCFKPGVEIGAWCVPRVLSVDTARHRTIVSDTAEYVGGQLPRYEMAVGSTVSWRRALRFYAQFDGKFAYKIYNLRKDFRDRTVKNSAEVNLPAGRGGYSDEEMLRRMGPFVAQTSGAPVGATLVRDPYIVPGDFLRLRELSVTWTLPTSVTERLRVTGSSVTIGGRNLWLATRYSGWDPEVNGADIQAFLYRADVFTIPQTRRLFARLTAPF